MEPSIDTIRTVRPLDEDMVNGLKVLEAAEVGSTAEIYEYIDLHPTLRNISLIEYVMGLAESFKSKGDGYAHLAIKILALRLTGSERPDAAHMVASFVPVQRNNYQGPRPELLDLLQVFEFCHADGLIGSCHPDVQAQLYDLGSHIVESAYKSHDKAGPFEYVDELIGYALQNTPNDSTKFKPWQLARRAYNSRRIIEIEPERDTLQRTIEYMVEAIDSNVESGINVPKCSIDLAFWFAERSRRTGDRVDLEEAIRRARYAASASVSGSQVHNDALNDLSVYQLQHYQTSGDLAILDDAAESSKQSLKTSTDGQHRPIRLVNLFRIQHSKFLATRELSVLHSAIGYGLEALGCDHLEEPIRSEVLVELILPVALAYDHTKKEVHLNQLATWLKTRSSEWMTTLSEEDLAAALQLLLHSSCGEQTIHDLERLEVLASTAMDETANDNRYHSSFAHAAAIARLRLYDHRGDKRDLEMTVDYCDKGLATTKKGDSLVGVLHGTKAAALGHLFNLTNDETLLDGAVGAARQAVDLASNDDQRSLRMMTLSNQLATRYEAAGDMSDLDHAIELAEESLVILRSNSQRPGFMSNLSNRLAERYDHGGDTVDLWEAAKLAGKAVDLSPGIGPDQVQLLHNAGARSQALYDLTVNRSFLEQAIDFYRRAVDASGSNASFESQSLRHLSDCLAKMHKLTGEQPYLQESLSLARDMLSKVGSDHFKIGLANTSYANRLLEGWASTGNSDLLSMAVRAATDAVGSSDSFAHRVSAANVLCGACNSLYTETGDVIALQQAVDMTREVISELSLDDNNYAYCAATYCRALMNLARADGSRPVLKEAREVLTKVKTANPLAAAAIADAHHSLAQFDGDYSSAIERGQNALKLFRAEAERLEGNGRELRDLAVQTEGILADLAASLSLAGLGGAAIDLIEQPRVWLRGPNTAGNPTDNEVETVWVATGVWETVVVNASGEVRRAGFGRQVVRDAIAAAILATRSPWKAPHDEVKALCALANQITTCFPDVERLQVVPLGLCSLLPFAAGCLADGTTVVERMTLSIAPTQQWALASRRVEPAARSVGVFHPGSPPLNLEPDREIFEESFEDGLSLTSPSAAEVLSKVSKPTKVLHLSCHAAYNEVNPLETALYLQDALTLRQLLDSGIDVWMANLSGCETGVPDLSCIEQHISLPTGLALGSTSHVISTLWSVEDRDAAAFNRHFYRCMASTSDPALATKQGILAVRAEHPDESPYNWAAFVHQGWAGRPDDLGGVKRSP